MEWSTQSRRVTLTSCMDEMRQTRGHLEPRDVFAMSEYDDANSTRQTRRPRAHSCQVQSFMCLC